MGIFKEKKPPKLIRSLLGSLICYLISKTCLRKTIRQDKTRPYRLTVPVLIFLFQQHLHVLVQKKKKVTFTNSCILDRSANIPGVFQCDSFLCVSSSLTQSKHEMYFAVLDSSACLQQLLFRL